MLSLLAAVLILLLVLLPINTTHAYNRPGCPGWPSSEVWDSELRQQLTDPSFLHGPFTRFPNTAYARQCLLPTPQTLESVLNTPEGLCQANHACVNQRCHWRDRSNLPAYTLEAHTVVDIQTALAFCDNHDIAVSVKGTGHNWQGQNSHAHSLLIWVRNFPRGDTLTHDFVDTCGTHSNTTITVHAGEMWSDVMDRIGDAYIVVKGICGTVGASGGWVNGGGLSELSREYGYGVDNVRSFTVVLANGTLVTADACSHPDLFWALRGGGGGNWGIVVSVEHQLHPRQPMAALDFGSLYPLPVLWNGVPHQDLIEEWVRFFVTQLPYADDWAGGFLNPTGGSLRFMGTVEQARNSSLIKAMDAWYNHLVFLKGILPAYGQPSTLIAPYTLLPKEARGTNVFQNVLAYSTPASFGRGMSRFLPLSVVQDEAEDVVRLIADLLQHNELMNIYYLGGKASHFAENATSTHPGLRRVVFGLEPINDSGNDKILEFARGRETDWGVSYNHHDALEPRWKETLFGPHYDRLYEIKQRYDPKHRFNVYHGVDYREYDDAFRCGRNNLFVNAGYMLFGIANFLGLVIGGNVNSQMGVGNGIDGAH